jgi:hypothetical protein
MLRWRREGIRKRRSKITASLGTVITKKLCERDKAIN